MKLWWRQTENSKKETWLITQGIKGKKFRKQVAFERVHRQGHSEDPAMKVMGCGTTGVRERNLGKLQRALKIITFSIQK